MCRTPHRCFFFSGCPAEAYGENIAKASGQRQNESKFIGFSPKSVHLHTYTINL
ncbi:hypothetical protein M066_3871 [Bacteroides fragilis str. I1345]|nr:hypothetical protein M066_3871 [Bacteroides fragilis str. I1345]